MAGLQEQPRWENEVYRIEENDPVHGGENGITNKPIKQLANRTKYLKQELEKPATTEQVGRVQLDSSTNSTSETTAATPKAVKIVKDLIDALTRNLANYIPNSKKSNSVASTSSDTVATSYAVKQAYDKGVSAQNTAESANRNANGRVSKSGDTMTGNLVLPYLKATGRYISVTAQDSQYAGFDIIRQGNLGNWLARMEALPDKRWKFWTENAHEIYLPARSGTVALEGDVNRKVAKSGDEMAWLKIARNHAWLDITSRSHASAAVDFRSWNGGASAELH